MTEATLTRWGNSQGIRIPKETCGLLGIAPGARAEVSVDPAASTMTLRFERTEAPRRYSRARKRTLEELAEERGWDGERAGAEWIGADVGAEVVR